MDEDMDDVDGGVPDVPVVDVEDPHWKVGDGMPTPDGKPDYVIGQIAVVHQEAHRYDVVFFDTRGVERGRFKLVSP